MNRSRIFLLAVLLGTCISTFAQRTAASGEPTVLVLTTSLTTPATGAPVVRLARTAQTITLGSLGTQTLCAGSTVALPFTVSSGYNAGNTFTAQLSDASGSFAAPVSIGTLSATGSGSIMALIPAGTPDGSGYRLRIVSSDPVSSSADNGSDLQVSGAPPMPVPNQVLCAGAATDAVNFTGGSGSYTWTNDNPAIGLAGSGSGNIPSFTAMNPGSTAMTAVIRVLSQTAGGCTSKPMVFRITAKPVPVLTNIPADQVRCAGTMTAPLNFSATVPGTIFRWTATNTLLGVTRAGSGDIPAYLALNPTPVPQVLALTVTPVAAGCSGAPATRTLTVHPAALPLSYGATTHCAAGTVSPMGDYRGGSYSASPAGLALDPVTGAIKLGASAPGTYTVVNTVNATGGCSPMSSTTITILPNATADAVANQYVCAGTNVGSIVFSGTAGSYSWTNDNPAIGLPGSGTGPLPAFTAAGVASTQYATIRVMPMGDGTNTCTGKQMAFRIAVQPCGAVAKPGDLVDERNALPPVSPLALSPNPARGSARIAYSGSGGAVVEVRDAFGRVVIAPRSISGNLLLDVSGLAPGTYYVQVVDQKTGARAQQKLVKL